MAMRSWLLLDCLLRFKLTFRLSEFFGDTFLSKPCLDGIEPLNVRQVIARFQTQLFRSVSTIYQAEFYRTIQFRLALR